MRISDWSSDMCSSDLCCWPARESQSDSKPADLSGYRNTPTYPQAFPAVDQARLPQHHGGKSTNLRAIPNLNQLCPQNPIETHSITMIHINPQGRALLFRIADTVCEAWHCMCRSWFLQIGRAHVQRPTTH